MAREYSVRPDGTYEFSHGTGFILDKLGDKLSPEQRAAFLGVPEGANVDFRDPSGFSKAMKGVGYGILGTAGAGALASMAGAGAGAAAAGGGGGGAGGAVESAAQGAADMASGGGVSKWLPVAVGVGDALSSYQQNKQAGRGLDLAEDQFAFQRQQYDERAPLRAMGMSRLGMGLPERPDLSSGFADPSNPFYKPPAALGFGRGDMGGGPSVVAPQNPGDPVAPPPGTRPQPPRPPRRPGGGGMRLPMDDALKDLLERT